MKIEYKNSPFWDNKRISTRFLIIHHTGSTNGKINSFEGTIKWFTDKSVHSMDVDGNVISPVSAHYAIPIEPYNGIDVVQFVLEPNVAYHAGKSEYNVDGKVIKWINRHSIGIELQGDGNIFNYTEYQYNTLIELSNQILQRHKDIRLDLVIGHEHISPGRKTDPGKLFDWKRYYAGLKPEIFPNTIIQNEFQGEKDV